jgi:predicted DNA-binding ribbon-helix-helix protein
MRRFAEFRGIFLTLTLKLAKVPPSRQTCRCWKYVMKTAVIKRSIFINGKKTSVSLENEFLDALHEIAEHKNTTSAKLAARQRSTVNLSTAIRVYVYKHFRTQEGVPDPARRHLDRTTLVKRAVECRALAEGLKDEEARAAMLRIATDYEQMAAVAARQERGAAND